MASDNASMASSRVLTASRAVVVEFEARKTVAGRSSTATHRARMAARDAVTVADTE
jgi:hypothetical protein